MVSVRNRQKRNGSTTSQPLGNDQLASESRNSLYGFVAGAHVGLWQIVLQKSPSGLCEIEICNYRIGAPVLLNRCCAFQPDLESIFLAEMLKILLQHNRHFSEVPERRDDVRSWG